MPHRRCRHDGSQIARGKAFPRGEGWGAKIELRVSAEVFPARAGHFFSRKFIPALSGFNSLTQARRVAGGPDFFVPDSGMLKRAPPGSAESLKGNS